MKKQKTQVIEYTKNGNKRTAGRKSSFIQTLIVTIGIALILRTFVVQAYEIPSGSMRLTLQEGDFLLAAKFLYGFKIPFTEASIGGWLEPKHQKISIFHFPLSPERDFVKRCIGLPGDTVEIKDKIVYVNGKQYKEPYTQFVDPVLRDKDFRKNMQAYTLKENELAFAIKPDAGNDLIVKIINPKGYPKDQEEFFFSCIAVPGQVIEMRNNEIFVEDKKIDSSKLLTFKDIFSHGYWPVIRDNFGPYIVPANYYFMLGDNRDDSLDSRFWGPVHKKYIFGEPLIIYMSWLTSSLDSNYASIDIFHRIRWNRLGVIIR